MRFFIANNDRRVQRFFKHCIVLVFGLLMASTSFGQEICTNGIDDDGDGLIDLNDTLDCNCNNSGTIELPGIIPNSSFEDANHCPGSHGSMYTVHHWIQPSSLGSSDYWNTCGQTQLSNWAPPPSPLPDGNGYVGFFNVFTYSENLPYQEYVGTCLNSPFLAGIEYEVSFYIAPSEYAPPFDISIYGKLNCNNNYFPYNGRDCPVGNGPWRELDQIPIVLDSTWSLFTFRFTPDIDIYSIIIGGACDVTNPSNIHGRLPYYYMDGISPGVTEANELLYLNKTGRWCENDIILHASQTINIGTYQWYKDGVALVGETGANLNVSANNYGAGDYTVMLLVNGTCKRKTISVEAEAQPTADASFNNVCFGEEVSFTDQSAISAGDILSWNWDFGDSYSSTQQNPNHEYDEAGTYNISLTVETDSGCASVFQATVDIYPLPTIDFSTNVTEGCSPLEVVFEDESSITFGNSINQWHWDFGDGNTSGAQHPEHTYNDTGEYTITLVATSDKGCTDTFSIVGMFNVYPLPVASINTDTSVASFPHPVITFTGEANDSISEWIWDMGDGQLNFEQNFEHEYGDTGHYVVELRTINMYGCADTVLDTIQVIGEFDLHIPNVFTPNNDGINEGFPGASIGIEKYSLQVFNRWGQELYNSTNPQEGWNGKISNKGQLAPDGIYYYLIKLENVFGEHHEYKGFVHLIH